MSRGQKKGPYVDEALYGKVMRVDDGGSTAPIKTWSRACPFVPASPPSGGKLGAIGFQTLEGRIVKRIPCASRMIGIGGGRGSRKDGIGVLGITIRHLNSARGISSAKTRT